MRETLDVRLMNEALLTPTSPWRSVDAHASLDSTNLEALRRPEPWRVVLADHQRAGRGRLARHWEAPERASIAVSCVVPTPADRPADWGWLPLLGGLAMRDTVANVASLEGRLKWPNDVLVREGTHDGAWLKVSGILCELVPTGDLVVAGAGANVDQSRDELPVSTATSLRLCGVTQVRREDLIVAYLSAFAALHRAWMEGGPSMESARAAYRSSCLTIGQDVDVHRPGGAVASGRAVDVDDAGRLVLASGGVRTAHAAGDVVHVRRSIPA